MQFTNTQNLSIPLAAFALLDDYDHSRDPSVISATSLLKPVRAIVLQKQNAAQLDRVLDVMDLIPSAMGTSMHNHLERALNDSDVWEKLRQVFGFKGQPFDYHVEERSERQVGAFTVTGKFDLVMAKQVHDLKSTSVWAYIFGSKNEDYKLQLSIYRWLNPEIIEEDIGQIHFIFTDWSAVRAKQEPDTYPQSRCLTIDIPLMTLDETEYWINERIHQIQNLLPKPQSALPLCSPKELWQDDPVWKYYKNPEKKSRATKNFDNEAEAQARLAEDGFVGEVVKFDGVAKHCKYCAARPVCNQADNLNIAE